MSQELGADPRLIGAVTVLEPQAVCDSSSRSAMRAAFTTQMTTLAQATARRQFTGAEREYGKYTMHVKSPCDARVIKVLNKYPRSLGIHTFKKNSESIIIYEDMSTMELGYFVIPNFHNNHKIFGFEYKRHPLLRNLKPGDVIPAGTVLADSPSVQVNGDYHYGIETNTAFMSVPGIIQDGVIVSDEYCKKIASKGYATRILEWDQTEVPLNLYGNEHEYKYFPDIGEKLRPDGILFATRKYDPLYAICDMCEEALKHIDHTFDDISYIQLSSIDDADLPIVEDVNVTHSHNPDLHKTPPAMEKQAKRYHQAGKIYRTQAYEVYQEEFRKKGSSLKVSHALHAYLVGCCINDNDIPKMQLPKSAVRTYRKSKIGDWRIELKVGWNITPTIGSKISDMHGGKGVICAIWEKERMPIDDFGNQAEMIVFGGSTLSRTNFGRFNEQYINATTIHIERSVRHLIKTNQLTEATKLLFEYYKHVSPMMYEHACKVYKTEEDKQQHTLEASKEPLRIWIPPNSPNIGAECIKALMDHFPLPISPVNYIDDYGNKIRTLKPIIIGPMYAVVLEKIGDDWGASSIPKRQHHGILGKLTDADKTNLPWRDQGFKVFGESEVRLLLGTLHPEYVGTLVNFANNPAMCEDAARTILTAPTPTNIDAVVDYRKYAELPGRAVQYFNHMMRVSGVKVEKASGG